MVTWAASDIVGRCGEAKVRTEVFDVGRRTEVVGNLSEFVREASAVALVGTWWAWGRLYANRGWSKRLTIGLVWRMILLRDS